MDSKNNLCREKQMNFVLNSMKLKSMTYAWEKSESALKWLKWGYWFELICGIMTGFHFSCSNLRTVRLPFSNFQEGFNRILLYVVYCCFMYRKSLKVLFFSSNNICVLFKSNKLLYLAVCKTGLSMCIYWNLSLSLSHFNRVKKMNEWNIKC